MKKENCILWKELFVAALYETETAKLPRRMAEAEDAILRRQQELFPLPGDNIEEEEALDDALYALNALRNTYQCGRCAVEDVVDEQAA